MLSCNKCNKPKHCDYCEFCEPEEYKKEDREKHPLKGAFKAIDKYFDEKDENKKSEKDLPIWYCLRCKEFVSENDIIKTEYDIKVKIAIRNKHKICFGTIDYENSHKYMAQEYKLYKENLKNVGKIQLETARALAYLRHHRDNNK